MTFHHRHRHWALALLMTAMVALQGCEQKPAESTRASTSPATAQAAQRPTNPSRLSTSWERPWSRSCRSAWWPST
ncbi:Uncharacterised protein [Klebsiella pneumoniae]|uniref:Uncharacterized protein n=1 Tax=Klebsiella pneumoniae TaxID=573 RepID=A0A378A0Q9_KLEPN|nr:Uncharacterised protein [Klebsiella pneumoniae]